MSQIPTYKPVSEISEDEGGKARPLSYAESPRVARIVTKTFKVGGYSYTSLADAVAQARRMQAQGMAL